MVIAAVAGFSTGKFYIANRPAVVVNDHRFASERPAALPEWTVLPDLKVLRYAQTATTLGFIAKTQRAPADILTEYRGIFTNNKWGALPITGDTATFRSVDGVRTARVTATKNGAANEVELLVISAK